MDAGKRMLEEAQRRAAATAKTAGQANSNSNVPAPAPTTKPSTTTTTSSSSTGSSTGQPPITPVDLTLILQFPPSSSLTDDLQDQLTASYGPINHVFIKDPPEAEGSKKKKRGKKAIVEFTAGNWGGCWACWRDLDQPGQERKEGWEGVKVKWAAGSIPEWVAWSETHRPIPRSQPPPPPPSRNANSDTQTNSNPNTPLPTFSSAPNFGTTTMSDLLASHSQSRADQANKKKREDEFESMTLLKMRQMERERLIEEIRREEEA
jgi:DnaJ family protein C protein 17